MFYLFLSFLIGAGANARSVPWIQSQSSAAIQLDSPSTNGGWEPTGYDNMPISADCHWRQLEKKILAGGTEQNRGSRVQSWFENCGPMLAKDAPPSPLNLLKYVRLNHRLTGNPYLRKVAFRLSDGRVLRGLVAFKDSSRPRPLVIAVSGIFGNAADGATPRSFFMHLFEESPFHLIVLASPSGSDFSKENQAVALSGFDGGAQIMEVARQVMDSGLRAKVSSIHLAGVSLGSHGSFYAALYNSAPGNPFPKIASVTAICPVVDLEASIRKGFTGALRGALYEMQTREYLQAVGGSVPFLNQLPLVPGAGRSQLGDRFGVAGLAYYQNLLSRRVWPYLPFEGARIDDLDDLVEINQFQNFAPNVHAPTWAIYGRDDGLVVPKVNSKILTTVLKSFPNPSLGVTALANGNHCAISASYGWKTMTTLLRSNVFAHSKDREQWLRTSLRLPLTPQARQFPMGESGRVAAYGWELKAGSPTVSFYLRAFLPVGRECENKLNHLAVAPAGCSPEFSASIPVATLESVGLRIPGSTYEANLMSRWLNSNSWILGPDGRELTGQTNTLPAMLEVRGHFEL